MRIDFYILKDVEPQAYLILACRLLEKAYLRRHTIYVHCQDKQEAETLDELLWTFKDASFIPHNLQGEGPEPPPAVQLGYRGEPRGFNDILLNLATQIPPFYQRFRRVMEIVRNEETAREVGRMHFREYKSKGYELNTHSLELVAS